MKVLHISTYDLTGGAALAAFRLHQAMAKREDCNSSMLVMGKKSQGQDIVKARFSKKFFERFRDRMEQSRVANDHSRHASALKNVELFSDDRGIWNDSIRENVKGADLLQLHWVSQFLNYRPFFQHVPQNVPLVWRLADMNAFTGGCHYDEGCGRFEDACGSCPKLQSKDARDLSHAILSRKKAALNHIADDRLHIVALNAWMAGNVKRSSLFGRFACTIIPNGVSLDEFWPVPRHIARAALGIPEQRQVLAFVAESAANVRKGFHLLCEALQRFQNRQNLLLLVVGASQHLPALPLPTFQVGFVDNAILLRQIYSAADVFIIPSIEDNQPNTVLEAMACGAPVVGFQAGGIPEMVEHGKTGLLAPVGDVQALAHAIELLLADERGRSSMGSFSRQRVEQGFSRAAQVQRYLDLYRTLLGGGIPQSPALKRPNAPPTVRMVPDAS